LPGSLKIILSDKEGKREYKAFERSKFRMLESFRMFPCFPEIVSEIKTRNGSRMNRLKLK
jgi:hypothetical protein